MVSGAGAVVPGTLAIVPGTRAITYRPLEILPIETPPVSRDIYRPLDKSPMIVPSVFSTFVESQQGRVGGARTLAVTK